MGNDQDLEWDPLMTVDQVSAYLNVSRNTLHYWRKTGRGPRGIRMGKVLRYRRSAVEEWIESCTESVPGAGTAGDRHPAGPRQGSAR